MGLISASFGCFCAALLVLGGAALHRPFRDGSFFSFAFVAHLWSNTAGG